MTRNGRSCQSSGLLIPNAGTPKNSATGSRELMNRINPHPGEIRFKLTECYYKLKTQNSYITAESIKRLYTGEDKVTNSLLSLFEYHTLNSKEVLKWGTLKNYAATEKYVRRFLKERYRTDDIHLSELNYQFITQFDLFLRTTEQLEKSNPLTNNGVMKHIERLRKAATMGFKMGWIFKDTFVLLSVRVSFDMRINCSAPYRNRMELAGKYEVSRSSEKIC